MNHIQRAIDHFGSRQGLAEATGASEQAISFWVNGKRKISPHYAWRIHDATMGQVSVYDLLPDVFGSPSVKHPAAPRVAAQEGRS